MFSNIFLPHHISEGGAIPLIRPTADGTGCCEEIKRYRPLTILGKFLLLAKIARWRKDLHRLFSSVPRRSHSDYQDLTDYEVTSSSGWLHRLIAWGYTGKLDPDDNM